MSSIRRAVAADLPRIAALARWVWLDTYASHGVTAAFAAYVEDAFRPETLARALAQDPMWVIEGPPDVVPPKPGARTDVKPNPRSRDDDIKAAGLPAAQALAPAPDLPLQAWAALDSHTEPGRVELTRLYVAPTCQGLGFGAALLRHARQAHSTRSLWLSAWEGNARALTFYRREGATQLGETWFELDGRRHRNEVLGWPPLETTT
ncbi:GNAT family N-acetyltransferase [Roseateles amylovorans]|uniref:GNAT family N-acetyltransferase n=1 Tax=Roseateles amylovorans TaxID=2978473 RepID=A0ABY6B2T8_9BURK|nr:GNAT family N-acetyltransferase [Roseateles amylovorans]UXH77600.1 GNAT family N-acetyltransferase [Roseateles amylovorans]